MAMNMPFGQRIQCSFIKEWILQYIVTRVTLAFDRLFPSGKDVVKAQVKLLCTLKTAFVRDVFLLITVIY